MAATVKGGEAEITWKKLERWHQAADVLRDFDVEHGILAEV
jgi:hypothetical protein